MDKIDIFKDISKRTNGDVYLGIVGAVRTGKSTFIKRFMELVVLPNIQDEHDRSVHMMNYPKVLQEEQL